MSISWCSERFFYSAEPCIFLGILLLVLAANWTAQLLPEGRTLWVVFALLLACCLLPLARCGERRPALRRPALILKASAAVLTGSIIFRSAMIRAR